MRKTFLRVTLLAAMSTAVLLNATAAGVPKLDKPKLEAYLRYAEAYGPQIHIDIDDLSRAPVAGYYRVLVHLTRDAAKLDRVYYTPNGEHFTSSAIWDLNSSPFIDTLEQLPTSGFSFGPPDAEVTIVLFSDFECPYCRGLAQTIRHNVARQYPRDVRVVLEDFPLEKIHPWARGAAEAGQCLGRQKQDAFWAWHDWTFDHQADITEANLRQSALQIAKDQHLDTHAVSTCMDTHAAAPVVEKSIKAGQALQIQQTPTFFINGRMVNGAIPWSTLDALIQIELKRPSLRRELQASSVGKFRPVLSR